MKVLFVVEERLITIIICLILALIFILFRYKKNKEEEWFYKKLRGCSKVGIIICDLNGLKSLNDSTWNKCGDIMIKEASRILNKYSSENIIVSRIGGDEFSIILTDVDEGSEGIKINISMGIS